mmetsp:Transcript_6343/g.9499  ORF Transcript_6343/g.9499 Transcript_6343/m.9499 type:complete len:155 (+) Transcript_6343:115-579(+)|eukprot:CAMPEP_0171454838 /NCGR_PEP_ID=MMETSP0945-20130129/1968_1 /TAXON_ID=109269 /ORGANISM="Vaucheria litorea, Strain CCMP2940" /LENGTH=154 /DNA_ID=CAMNT_0011979949 /DNA_START=115 /DNA_END=579 /DNA_ORIENTATION=+
MINPALYKKVGFFVAVILGLSLLVCLPHISNQKFASEKVPSGEDVSSKRKMQEISVCESEINFCMTDLECAKCLSDYSDVGNMNKSSCDTFMSEFEMGFSLECMVNQSQLITDISMCLYTQSGCDGQMTMSPSMSPTMSPSMSPTMTPTNMMGF